MPEGLKTELLKQVCKKPAVDKFLQSLGKTTLLLKDRYKECVGSDPLLATGCEYVYQQWLQNQSVSVVNSHRSGLEPNFKFYEEHLLYKIALSVFLATDGQIVVEEGDVDLAISYWRLSEESSPNRSFVAKQLPAIAEKTYTHEHVCYDSRNIPVELDEWQKDHNQKLFEEACEHCVKNDSLPASSLRKYWVRVYKNCWAKEPNIKQYLLQRWCEVVSSQPLPDMQKLLVNSRNFKERGRIASGLLLPDLERIVHDRLVRMEEESRSRLESAANVKDLKELLENGFSDWERNESFDNALKKVLENTKVSETEEVVSLLGNLCQADRLSDKTITTFNDWFVKTVNQESVDILVNALFSRECREARDVLAPAIVGLFQWKVRTLPRRLLEDLGSSMGYADEAAKLASSELRRRSLSYVQTMKLETAVARCRLCRSAEENDPFCLALKARIDKLLSQAESPELLELVRKNNLERAYQLRQSCSMGMDYPWSQIFERIDELRLARLNKDDLTEVLNNCSTLHSVEARAQCMSIFLKGVKKEEDIIKLCGYQTEILVSRYRDVEEFTRHIMDVVEAITSKRTLTEEEVCQMASVPSVRLSPGVFEVFHSAISASLPLFPFPALCRIEKQLSSEWSWTVVASELSKRKRDLLPAEIARVYEREEDDVKIAKELLVLYGDMTSVSEQDFFLETLGSLR
ncbi:hypothetical protein KC865_00950 [Candidatus Kaiserbacteria bacterium]|nr:hypothetical protein [Candidatus Kaiserbacteria bacterium]